MSSDFIEILMYFPSMIWSLLTSFRIPGLNFTPAVLIFGVLSFGLAIKFISGILEITTRGVSNKDKGKE